nr:MAG TPA: hypothetical protein [Caudoviricetes sp.]
MFGSYALRPPPIQDLPYPPYRLLNMHYNEGGSSPIVLPEIPCSNETSRPSSSRRSRTGFRAVWF